MAELTYVCLYLDYLDTFAPLSDAARGKLVMAMLHYASTGESPALTGPAKFIWPGLRSQIDRDRENYREVCARNRINGSRGGRPPKNPGVFEKPKKPNEKEKENENVKDKDNVKENENERENIKEKENTGEYRTGPAGQALPPSDFSFPPTVSEVEAFCLQQGLKIDAAHFVDHYTSNGWKVGGYPMQNWQAAVRNWWRKEKHFGKTEMEGNEPSYGIVL